MKERLVAAVAAILLSFLLHSLNDSIAWGERRLKGREREGLTVHISDHASIVSCTYTCL